MSYRIDEIAAAGRHNVFVVGTEQAMWREPKLLALAISLNQPSMSSEETNEINAIESAAGMGEEGISSRPMSEPHYTAPEAGLVGSSKRIGDLWLCHNGVLVLKELPEFRRSTLDALFRGLTGEVRIRGRAPFPLRVQVIASALLGQPEYYMKQAERYFPWFDLFVELPPEEIQWSRSKKQTKWLADQAWDAQESRFRSTDLRFNSEMDWEALGEFMLPTPGAVKELGKVPQEREVQVGRVARTIADMDGKERVSAVHIKQARQVAEGVDRTESLRVNPAKSLPVDVVIDKVRISGELLWPGRLGLPVRMEYGEKKKTVAVANYYGTPQVNLVTSDYPVGSKLLRFAIRRMTEAYEELIYRISREHPGWAREHRDAWGRGVSVSRRNPSSKVRVFDSESESWTEVSPSRPVYWAEVDVDRDGDHFLREVKSVPAGEFVAKWRGREDMPGVFLHYRAAKRDAERWLGEQESAWKRASYGAV